MQGGERVGGKTSADYMLCMTNPKYERLFGMHYAEVFTQLIIVLSFRAIFEML